MGDHRLMTLAFRLDLGLYYLGTVTVTGHADRVDAIVMTKTPANTSRSPSPPPRPAPRSPPRTSRYTFADRP